MKKYMKIFIATLLVLLIATNTALASENDITVRVRIRSPRLFNEQVQISGYSDITVTNNLTNEELFQIEDKLSFLIDTYYDNNFNILTGADLLISKIGPYHILLNDSYSSYEQVTDAIEEMDKVDAYPYYNGDNFEIYLGTFPNKSMATDYLNNNNINGEIINGNKQNVVVYNEFNEIILIYSNNYNLLFTSYNEDLECNMINVDNKPYRGMIAFDIDDLKLMSINHVDLESYLYGVVPSESPASWPLESLKAQAVTARTYAVYNLTPNYSYDLEDNASSQVYLGYRNEYATTNKAVDETKGKMIYYGGKLIQAVFHSTSGGSTENSENVWVSALPYLRGVEDEYSNISPRTYWEVNYTKENILDKLKADGNDVSELYGVEITKVSENGRVLECIFLTDIGNIPYKKQSTQFVLDLDSQWFSIEGGGKGIFYFTTDKTNQNNVVPSRGVLENLTDDETKLESLATGNINNKYLISSEGAFKFNNKKVSIISSKGVTVSDLNSDTYNITGYGWGHGVGMSQYGAKQMATEGFTYNEILKHYYTGVDIE